jgi:N-acetylglucosaminyldiphosphoundecaprenol N-acetyl-beta-D-mannosaminyltransferase
MQGFHRIVAVGKYMATKADRQLGAGRANVLGVGVHAIDMEATTSILVRHVKEKRKGYVCLVGVHGVMEARRDHGLRTVFAEATLLVPDGMPTVWIGHMQGHSRMRRVFGPELMIEIFSREEFRNCVHFLCGGEPGVAEKLRGEMLGRFPWVQIAGTYTPPFRPMTAEEENELAELVHSLHIDVIWVGLSTPKQEKFMARYLPILDTKLMIGVGAAFLFHTGIIKDSPAFIKQMGLQWLHRLLQEPGRLWKRYLRNNPLFILLAMQQAFGWRRYKVASPPPKNQRSVPN